MSTSVLEQVLTAMVTTLNTSRPGSVPVIERDRWVDVDDSQASLPVVLLSGYEDEPHANQNQERTVDMRRVMARFEIYTIKTATGVSPAMTATQASDAAVQWITKQCGTVELGTPLAGVAFRVTLEKRMAIMGKGDVCRCLLELGIDYRNLTNDITRVK
jgi:hypothetical protein